MTSEWTDELRQVAAELGEAEVMRRMAALGSYEKYDTLASAYDLDFSPVQLKAWAAFASTLGTGVIAGSSAIKREKSADDKALYVVGQELYKRQQEARKANAEG